MLRAAFITGLWISLTLRAQAPRVEDHFWRRKVVLTLDLREKVNAPLILGQVGLNTLYSTDPLTDKSRFSNREGVVLALLKGFREGKYSGYNPKNLSSSMSYEAFDEFTKGRAKTTASSEEEEEIVEDTGEDIDAAPADENIYKYYDTKLRIIEDRIFDKNRSSMYYDVQYICLTRVDPTGALLEEDAVCFRYHDVRDVLEDTQWRNRSNDAEDRSMRQIFELRRFSGYVTFVSGEVVRSLQEAETRRQQMIEFEHHLWTY
ncbi:MAG: hypothetical protein NZ580_04100 [Bacteroidia bacterium]|nr:hypothetical protein [Bacteroidia bacterium]MDW8235273.1 hypothetical protein [Bacteroidia bacterium]